VVIQALRRIHARRTRGSRTRSPSRAVRARSRRRRATAVSRRDGLRMRKSFPDESDGGGARVDSELGVDVFEVPPNGQRRYPQPFRDLRVRPALGDEVENLPLPLCEPGHRPLLGEEQRAVDELDHERALIRLDR
jgi:hypothetical protein